MDDKCAIHWNYVGATDMCLYIWLLSEILPKKVAIDGTANFESKQLSSSNSQFIKKQLYNINSLSLPPPLQYFNKKTKKEEGN
jgi:hypothetical protein